MLVFAADNGVCAEGVSCTPQSVTREQAVNMTRGLTGMSTLARFFGDEVIVTDVGILTDTHCPAVRDRSFVHPSNRGLLRNTDAFIRALLNFYRFG